MLFNGEITETIKSIEDVSFGGYSGYEVVTSHRTIKCGISDDYHCCEVCGYYLTTEDDAVDYIGATLLKVAVDDGKELPLDSEVPVNAGTMFVNFYTDRGLLQFVTYNDHNGQYVHAHVVLQNDKKIHSETF